ncbi:hypothetical protein FAM22279_00060 [Lacticaseibacillus paracasei]|uniref:hypothetical protein n=1 Tax=Lacticaseibacillus paracasei TaxID=1597 RepID=UPI000FEF6472|nr:hypothetical protein [Lacticaseibacillus paracasei]RNE12818.1 hypothetical protein FAM22279_00060 [Lacticaseibacillus paracasei]
MALAIFNLLSIILIFIIIWLTRKEKVATRAGRYNRAFLIIIAVIEIVLIISETFIFKVDCKINPNAVRTKKISFL